MNEKSIKSFWGQLKKRKVTRVGIVYLVVGWSTIQIWTIFAIIRGLQRSWPRFRIDT